MSRAPVKSTSEAPVKSKLTGEHAASLQDKLGLTAEERRKFEVVSQQAKREAHILVAGKTGVGKSKLVNGLVGTIVTTEGHGLDPQTSVVECHEVQSECGYAVMVWDSPGLRDGTGRDSKYLQEMKKCCESIDILLYCIDMSARRANVDEISREIALLSQTLGVDVWKHAIVVLTHANVVACQIAATLGSDEEIQKKTKFLEKVEQWKEKVCSAFGLAGVPPKVIKDMPIEPAGDYLTPDLPDRIHWLGYLWLVFLCHMRDEAKLAILVNNGNRIQSAEYLAPNLVSVIAYSRPRLFILLEWIARVFPGSDGRSSGPVGQLCSQLIKKTLARPRQLAQV